MAEEIERKNETRRKKSGLEEEQGEYIMTN